MHKSIALRMALAAIPLLVVLLGPDTLAQTTESEEVLRLTASDVGPFRPTDHPTLVDTKKMIVDRTNAFRRKKGLDPLQRNDELDATAQDFADYMARTDRYGHTADGRQSGARARAHDYPYCLIAENIAYQFHTTGFGSRELAKGTVRGWKRSPGHRKNMLRKYVTQMGVGAAQSESTGVYYLVQLFGRPRSAAINFDLSNRTSQAIQYSLGDRSHELPPGFTRFHEMCVPAKLEIEADGKTAASLTPSSDQHLVVTDDNGLTIDAQTEPPSNPRPKPRPPKEIDR